MKHSLVRLLLAFALAPSAFAASADASFPPLTRSQVLWQCKGPRDGAIFEPSLYVARVETRDGETGALQRATFNATLSYYVGQTIEGHNLKADLPTLTPTAVDGHRQLDLQGSGFHAVLTYDLPTGGAKAKGTATVEGVAEVAGKTFTCEGLVIAETTTPVVQCDSSVAVVAHASTDELGEFRRSYSLNGQPAVYQLENRKGKITARFEAAGLSLAVALPTDFLRDDARIPADTNGTAALTQNGKPLAADLACRVHALEKRDDAVQLFGLRFDLWYREYLLCATPIPGTKIVVQEVIANGLQSVGIGPFKFPTQGGVGNILYDPATKEIRSDDDRFRPADFYLRNFQLVKAGYPNVVVADGYKKTLKSPSPTDFQGKVRCLQFAWPEQKTPVGGVVH